jgi:hypothetical protein
MLTLFKRPVSATLYYAAIIGFIGAPLLIQTPVQAVEKVEQVTDGNLQKRMLNPFKKLHIEGNFQVHLAEGSESVLTIEGDPASFSLLSSRVSNETLTIKPKKPRKSSHSLSDFPQLVLHLTGKQIEEIAFLGNNNVSISEINSKSLSLDIKGSLSGEIGLKVEDLKCKAFGVYDVKFSGSATEANFNFYGSGNCNAQNMQVDICKLISHGTGDLSLNVQDKLGAKLTGTTRLIYSGGSKAKISTIGAAQAMSAEEVATAAPSK